MRTCLVLNARKRKALTPSLLLLCCAGAWATDWPQYRGPATDGSSPDMIATTWATNSASFVVWTNMSLTNGFSSFAVSQGRAFTLISKKDGGGNLNEYCVGVDAATGTNLWATPIDDAQLWDPSVSYNGGDGKAPCNTGDGPRTTPAIQDGRVFALSGANLNLVCLNATNGTVIWSNNLPALYGASTLGWNNGASPRLDQGLIFVNLHNATAYPTLAAFNTTNGALAWRSQNKGATYGTPVVATIEGVRQVIFPTADSLVSLDRNTGNLLWTYAYPYGPVSVAMGASPVVYSNIVFVTLAYTSGGSAAVRITLNNSIWTATQLWASKGDPYRSTWMTPVCYQGYLYGQFSDKGFTNTPLICIELATGVLKWSVNNFGMGGIILVNTNLLVVTEDGQLVLVRPNPSAYTEVARYRAFQFTTGAPGKCWNCAAFSNGRIYARSTRGAISLDVSVPAPLKLLAPQFLSSTQLQLVVSTVNGTPLDSNRLSRIEVRATNSPAISPSLWPKLTNPLVLTTNGLARLTNTIGPGQSRQFYRAAEQP